MLVDNLTLYHGSYMKVVKPDLAMCNDGKDFGKGFYLTTDKNQAIRFVKSSIGKAQKNGLKAKNDFIGYVNEYKFSNINNLNIYNFDVCNKEWLRCVAAHRKRELLEDEFKKWIDYDIMTGKIANDTTNRVIVNYMNGDFGDINSDNAVNIAISLLKPEKLSDQECFRTEKSLEKLVYIKSEEVNCEKS